MPTDISYLQVNMWGLIGTLLAVIALFLSLRNASRIGSKIIMTKLDLIIINPIQFAEWFSGKTKDQIKDHILYFNLQTTLRNFGGNSGSIDKPTLIITVNPSVQIKVSPIRSYFEPADKANVNAWKNQSIQQEASWFLKSGQILNEEIIYVIDNMDDLFLMVDSYSNLKYSIEYTDNYGKNKRQEITSIFVEK